MGIIWWHVNYIRALLMHRSGPISKMKFAIPWNNLKPNLKVEKYLYISNSISIAVDVINN